ncbi:hypothetical protein ABAC460_07735 [Asticcacaulis sp. AC460]|uniref:DUF3597 domain-containing protein n=1 Tax=Asticcacaulis sp. AC460 TaxID=1282360 RepID=UPI0003C3FA5D|nr:DUF3597 domain-containing protein [Asticcacaulis sp. AC460]ESQ90711.1 hypothetical protein ABAC460_07735 [Asticcacaulis sp. AC460]
MGIFSNIKDFLFGKKFITVGKDNGQPAAPQARQNPAQASPAAPVANPASASIVLDPPHEAVDIEAILDREAAESGQQLNWRQSIVDLMKLCGIDSSLQHRKDLARELGYTGDTNDSATMNIWLHKQVMRKLAESGGKVPAELKD